MYLRLSVKTNCRIFKELTRAFDRTVLHEAVLLFKNPESFCFDAKFSSELI